MPKYDVKVQLSGEDGNAFAILGTVKRALRRADVSQELINKFFEEATAGDYDHLLRVCMEWVDIE